MVLYSGGENPHTKSVFRGLGALQLASHHAKTDKLRTQRIHARTHARENMRAVFQSCFCNVDSASSPWHESILWMFFKYVPISLNKYE